MQPPGGPARASTSANALACAKLQAWCAGVLEAPMMCWDTACTQYVGHCQQHGCIRPLLVCANFRFCPSVKSAPECHANLTFNSTPVGGLSYEPAVQGSRAQAACAQVACGHTLGTSHGRCALASGTLPFCPCRQCKRAGARTRRGVGQPLCAWLNEDTPVCCALVSQRWPVGLLVQAVPTQSMVRLTWVQACRPTHDSPRRPSMLCAIVAKIWLGPSPKQSLKR